MKESYKLLYVKIQMVQNSINCCCEYLSQYLLKRCDCLRIMFLEDKQISTGESPCIKIPVALFDELRYNEPIMKYYAISLILFKKVVLWQKVNT